MRLRLVMSARRKERLPLEIYINNTRMWRDEGANHHWMCVVFHGKQRGRELAGATARDKKRTAANWTTLVSPGNNVSFCCLSAEAVGWAERVEKSHTNTHKTLCKRRAGKGKHYD